MRACLDKEHVRDLVPGIRIANERRNILTANTTHHAREFEGTCKQIVAAARRKKFLLAPCSSAEHRMRQQQQLHQENNLQRNPSSDEHPGP